MVDFAKLRGLMITTSQNFRTGSTAQPTRDASELLPIVGHAGKDSNQPVTTTHSQFGADIGQFPIAVNPRRPFRGRVGKPNFSDAWIRGLQKNFVREIRYLQSKLPGSPHQIAPKREDPVVHASMVSWWRRRIGMSITKLQDIPRVKEILLRWQNYCSPVGTGSRSGTRCQFRFCPDCLAMRHSNLRMEIEQRLAAYPKVATIRSVRVARRHIYCPYKADVELRIRDTLAALSRETRAALKQLDHSDGVVITAVRSVKRFRQTEPILIARGYAICIETFFLFVGDRTPQAVHLNSWAQKQTPNSPRELARLLIPILSVPYGMAEVEADWLLELEKGFRKHRSFALRGSWCDSESPALAKCVAVLSSKECSPACRVLLDALGAPDEWIARQPATTLDCGWLSQHGDSRDGTPFPLKLVEQKLDIGHLKDLRQKTTAAALADALEPNRSDGLAGRVFRFNGEWFVVFPESFGLRASAGTGDMTCLVIPYCGGTYWACPISSALFIRSLWTLWTPPWICPHAKPPVFQAKQTMDPSYRDALGWRQGSFANEQLLPGREDSASIQELYRNLRWGRFHPADDLPAAERTLAAASHKRLGGLVLQALPAVHGQGLDKLFSWPRGIVGAEVERLYHPGCQRFLFEPDLPRGVVFSLYRKTPGARCDRPYWGATRVMLHNDRELVVGSAGCCLPDADVLAIVTVAGRGRFYLQGARSFYQRVRAVRPWLCNPEELREMEKFKSRADHRLFKHVGLS